MHNRTPAIPRATTFKLRPCRTETAHNRTSALPSRGPPLADQVRRPGVQPLAPFAHRYGVPSEITRQPVVHPVKARGCRRAEDLHEINAPGQLPSASPLALE